jgi:hypothetical protein
MLNDPPKDHNDLTSVFTNATHGPRPLARLDHLAPDVRDRAGIGGLQEVVDVGSDGLRGAPPVEALGTATPVNGAPIVTGSNSYGQGKCRQKLIKLL